MKFYQQKPDGTTETRYRVYSSVTGKLLTEIDTAGQKLETHIYSPNGQHRQMKSYTVYYSGGGSTTYPDTVVGEFSDPLGTRSRQWERQTNSYRDTHISPVGVPMEAINWQVLKDRFVNGIAAQISYGQSQAVYYPYMRDIVEDPTNPGRGCSLDGQKISCAKVAQYARQGAIGSIGVSAPTGVIHGDGWAIGRTTDPDADNLNQGYLMSVEKLGIDVGDSGEQSTTTKPPCITPLWIANNPNWIPFYRHAWYETVESGDKKIEHGGWLFYDRKQNQTYLYMAGPGGKNSMPNEPEEFRALLSRFVKEGNDMAFIGAFHTHPGGDPNYGRTDPGNLDRSIKESFSLGGIGLIIYGVNLTYGADGYAKPHISFYDRDGLVIKEGDLKLNQCIPLDRPILKIQQ